MLMSTMLKATEKIAALSETSASRLVSKITYFDLIGREMYGRIL